MSSFSFKKADKLFWHDNIVAKLILWAIPSWIYPNYITIFRFLTTPLVFFLIYKEFYSLGIISFLIVAFTDVIDGSLARTRNQITDWGISYDPIADKLLIGGLLLILVFKHIGYLIPFLIIFIEVVIVFNAWLRRRRGKNIQANFWGKAKMFLHVLGVIFLLFGLIYDLDKLFLSAQISFWIAIGFALLSLMTGRL